MSKITNKLQLSNCLKSNYDTVKGKSSNSQSNQDYGLNQSVSHNNLQNPDVLNQIATECNKPLQSASWVATKNKAKYEWGYNSDRHYGVYRAVGNLWLCRDRHINELSDCEREQIKLYNKLKREYEKEKRLLEGKEVNDSVVTLEEKARARVRKIAYNLNREYYDRIYKCS
jgi:hypothetical protein